MTDYRVLTNQAQREEVMFWRNAMRLNTCIPAIINAFDPTTQTVSATPAIMAKKTSIEDESVEYIPYPMITNIPLSIIRGAGLSITQPITIGYPCTLIFSQRSIDNFILEKKEVPPVEGPNPFTTTIRCMDMTDAMCFPGIITQVDKLATYATDAIEIKSDDDKVKVSVKANSLTLKQDSATIELSSGNVTINAGTINITGTSAINISSPATKIGTATTIDNKVFLTHHHKGVSSGNSNTGDVA